LNSIGLLIATSLSDRGTLPLNCIALLWAFALGWLLNLSAALQALWLGGAAIFAVAPEFGIFACALQIIVLSATRGGFSTWFVVYPLGAISIACMCMLGAWLGQATGLAGLLPPSVSAVLFDWKLMLAGGFLAYFFFQGACLQFPTFFSRNRSLRRPFPELATTLASSAAEPSQTYQ
jgi:hypothetical protein